MRAVVQRVSSASVSVNQESIGPDPKGVSCPLGVERGDTDKDLHYIVGEGCPVSRVFDDDEEGRMNRSHCGYPRRAPCRQPVHPLGDARHGKRPSLYPVGPA